VKTDGAEHPSSTAYCLLPSVYSPLPKGAAPVSSKSQPVSEGESTVPVRTQPVDPLKNPSYPQRIHLHEKPHWQNVLRDCEERLAMARQKLDALGKGPRREAFERLFVQMTGARDQVADAVRRLPLETGDLYEEDRHRVEEAVAALGRVSRRWDELPTA
jgi:hypothetical protein